MPCQTCLKPVFFDKFRLPESLIYLVQIRIKKYKPNWTFFIWGDFRSEFQILQIGIANKMILTMGKNYLHIFTKLLINCINNILYEFQEIRQTVDNAKREIIQTAQQIGNSPCPQTGGCVTTTTLVALLVVQLIILISYMMYR